MKYEVEKRSKLANQDDFEKLKLYLDKNANFLGKKEMKSYLFQEPTFLRIRLVSGQENALITEKTGEYTDAGRPEHEFDIPLTELTAFVSQKETEGYKSCSLVHTTRYTYKLNNLKVELNDIDYLGLIVEVEALTEDELEIPNIEKEILATMEELNLKELDPTEYQNMMTSMYSQTLKNVGEHSFII